MSETFRPNKCVKKVSLTANRHSFCRKNHLQFQNTLSHPNWLTLLYDFKEEDYEVEREKYSSLIFVAFCWWNVGKSTDHEGYGGH